jgi:transcriptional regulator with XRE-family HTH domain
MTNEAAVHPGGFQIKLKAPFKTKRQLGAQQSAGTSVRSSTKSALAALLKSRRGALGLTQQSLARKVGVRASHVALLENGQRRPSLALAARLAEAMELDGRELLELAYPEIRTLVSPIPAPRPRIEPSWERLFKDPALLARYHVTKQEREVLKHLGMLGGTLTPKRLLAILLLARDIP